MTSWFLELLPGPEYFWLGGSDVDREGTWLWSATGETFGVSFDDWFLGQPNNLRGNQDCLSFRRCPWPNGTEFAWFDDNCSDDRHYICELMWWVGSIPLIPIIYGYCAGHDTVTSLPYGQWRWGSEGCLNIKMVSRQYRNSHYKGLTVVLSS